MMKNKTLIVLTLSLAYFIFPRGIIIAANRPDEHKCGFHTSLEQLRQNNWEIQGLKILRVDTLKFTLPSPSGRFLFHYDTTGDNAVPTEDLDKNGIPDYIDSAGIIFDHVYQVEVEDIGFIEPLPDKGKGGSEAVDVYFVDLGKRGLYGSTIVDERISQNDCVTRFTSFIKIDNNFSSTDTNTNNGNPAYPPTSWGINGLEITAAHEFNHVLQLAYGINSQTGLIAEMSATLMEVWLYPKIKDYYQYLPKLFENPQHYPFGDGLETTSGYRWTIYFIYISDQFGKEVIKRMWELLSDCYTKSIYEALDMALKEKESNLKEAWCDFLPWMYFTGKRAIDGLYFQEAKSYPELKFYHSKLYSGPEIAEDGDLKPFELRAYNFRLPDKGVGTDDTLDIVVSNADTAEVFHHTENLSTSQFELLISTNEISGSEPVNGTQYYWRFDDVKNTFCKYPVNYSGKNEPTLKSAYPNPFYRNSSEYLFLPAPEGAGLRDNVFVEILSVDGVPVHHDWYQVIIYQNKRVLRLRDIPADISSGVYIFALHYNDKIEYGKFAVKIK